MVLWSLSSSAPITHTCATLPTVILSFVASIGLCILSWLEHVRSICPSFIVEVYLFLSVLLNSARTRTLWMLGSYTSIPALFTASMGIQSLMVIFEATEKRSILKMPAKYISKETTSGTYSRSVFFWLTSLLFNGYRSLLSLHDLYPLEARLASEPLSSTLETSWNGGEWSSL